MSPGPPNQIPLGLALAGAARTVSRAFDQALAAAGGSLPVWLILLNLTIQGGGKQRDLAEAVGISEATLTHHLTALEQQGLLSRTRETGNRRVQRVELTAAGRERFQQLRAAAMKFDERLRHGLNEEQSATLRALLQQVTANVTPAPGKAPPWAGLIERGEPKR
jgi:MarR family transcriptional regulator, transcriptional regulator for hemolysin